MATNSCVATCCHYVSRCCTVGQQRPSSIASCRCCIMCLVVRHHAIPLAVVRVLVLGLVLVLVLLVMWVLLMVVLLVVLFVLLL